MQRFIVYIKQYVYNKLFVNRRFWKMHSTDLSKVPHRYAVMLTIHTRLVHPHPFVTERAAMFYNRVCHFRAKPRRYPCRIKKFRSTLHQLSGEYREFQIGAAAILRTRNCFSRIPRKSPLTSTIERPRRLSLLSRGFKLLLQLPLRVRRYPRCL